jgi:4-amino-4-deoxy-L-arabinose transferase-like glycosyltransferase
MTTASARHPIRHFIRQPGFILAAVNFCVGLVWITVIQRLDAPDEPAHLQAIMQVRKEHKLPEVHFAQGSRAGEIVGSPSDAETRAYILRRRSKLPVNDDYVLLPYKSVQPPLYYLAAGLVAQLVPPNPRTVLYVGRLVAVFFGAASVYFCWLAIRELAPREPIWALASAGTVALLPEFCFTNAHAANDSAVNFAATAAFYVWIRGLRHPEFDRRLLGAGAMLGLAFLCKLTAAVLIPGLALVVLFRMFQAHPSALGWSNWLKRALSMVAGAALGTVLVCGWWFIRNVLTYGEPSGTKAELRLVAGNFIKADFSDPRTADNLLRYTLESLWGRFGWNDITLHQEVYHFCNSAALLLICLTVLAGIGLFGLWVTRRRSPDVVAWQASLVFLAVGLTLFAGYIEYNARIAYQPQARYFFILLLPGALLLTGGVYAFAASQHLRAAVCTMLLVALAVLNALGLATIGKAGIAIGGARQHVASRSRPRARRGKFVHVQVATWSVRSQVRSGSA